MAGLVAGLLVGFLSVYWPSVQLRSSKSIREPVEMSFPGVLRSPWPSVVPSCCILKPLCNGICGFDSTVMGECPLVYMGPTMKKYI